MRLAYFAPLAFAVAALAADEGNNPASDTLFVRMDSEPIAAENAPVADSSALVAQTASVQDTEPLFRILFCRTLPLPFPTRPRLR